MTKTSLGVLISSIILSACSTTSDIQAVKPPLSFAQISEQVKQANVVILTDHTLSTDLNLSSGGAQGRERDFIDPAAKVFAKQLQTQGLSYTILKVEELIDSGKITTKEQFTLAYKNYDKLLQQAVSEGDTLISLHFDADIIMAEDYKGKELYIGGVQIILDERAVSNETFKLSYFLLNDYPLFSSLKEAGFRVRPGYEFEPRYQSNLTLNITGHSTGGGILLELAPQEQAIRLYGTAARTAQALEPSLAILAKSVADFRRGL
ncbi:hypothetical protein RC083_01230 [Pseudoalteromonas haloplanktis]|uniref:N-acetylmuramoyl-L-alanine amidase n=1 Tax=Pseudoalteromonas haloplanktis TaxID=228 RepID=A0ABU1B992_PSEHA|nr:hypothetical protein [Pseudoalteromonas haloplanktis]MDQ9090207.1 hypothetical protein [Pseudoalteromonas haloplanktis]